MKPAVHLRGLSATSCRKPLNEEGDGSNAPAPSWLGPYSSSAERWHLSGPQRGDDYRTGS